MTNRLADQWGPRDYPVLLRVAELLEVEHQSEARPEEVGADLGIEPSEACRSMVALYRGQYIDGLAFFDLQEDHVIAQSVTERGRRAVGLWPGEQDVDVLIRH